MQGRLVPRLMPSLLGTPRPGVGIIFLSLKFFTWLFSSYLGYDGFISGKYGNPPQALL